ncbi:hypothetical protein HG531_009668 [Fusarium graminearum]|nr:hypothetical protein HG531_009668 [Fusarium graminearum]
MPTIASSSCDADHKQELAESDQLCATSGSKNTKTVDEKIITVILPEDIYLAVFVLERPAVEEKGELGGESAADRDDSRKMKVLVSFRLCQLLTCEGNDDEGHGNHEEAEYNIPYGLKTSLASRETSSIDTADGSRRQDEGEITKRVENRVGHGGEKRKRARRDGSEKLKDRQQNVGCQRTPNCNTKLELIITMLIASFVTMFLDRLEHAINCRILIFVETLQLTSFDLGTDVAGTGLPTSGGCSLALDIGHVREVSSDSLVLIGRCRLKGGAGAIACGRVP